MLRTFLARLSRLPLVLIALFLLWSSHLPGPFAGVPRTSPRAFAAPSLRAHRTFPFVVVAPAWTFCRRASHISSRVCRRPVRGRSGREPPAKRQRAGASVPLAPPSRFSSRIRDSSTRRKTDVGSMFLDDYLLASGELP